MMRKRTIGWTISLACILIFYITSCTMFPLTTEQSDESIRLDRLVEDGLKENLYAGSVLLITRKGKTVYKRAYGFARKYGYDFSQIEYPEPMTTEHLFDVASMTKVFATTFGIMLLVDKGHIKLDDPVYNYIPSFDEGKKKNITIRNLLTHRAGLQPWKPIYYHASNRDKTLTYITSLPLKHPVGKEYHYSDLDFMVLGYLIESVSEKPLDKYLQENLYSPLGLEDITFCPREKGYEKIAATSQGNPFEYKMIAEDGFGFTCDEEIEAFQGWRHHTLHGEVNDGNSFYAHGGIAGHAGLFATADNLKILAELLINRGMFKKNVIIKPETIDAFFRTDEFGNGLGWSLNPKFIKSEGAPAGTFGHTGFTGCNVVVIPARNIIILFLTNRQNAGLGKSGHYPNLNKLRRDIVATVLKSDDKRGLSGKGGNLNW